jgi:hypothetical protein
MSREYCITVAAPLAPVRPHGTVVTRLPAGGLPRLVAEADRHGTPLTWAEWDAAGRLRRAKVRLPDGGWLGIEPGATEAAPWGRSDRLWRLGPDSPWEPLEPLTLFQAVDYGAIAFIPPLAEPARLPPGGGTAVLNFLATLLLDQGAPAVRYQGPYPTEQLFTALLESFRYQGETTDPLAEFMAGDLAWTPAPHERRFTGGAWVQLRDGVEKVVFRGRAYYRRRWQEVIRDEPRVVRAEAGRVVCSLWALGGPVEDHLVLDSAGEVIQVPPLAPVEGPQTPLSPRWRRALGELVAQRSTPLLRPSILGVLDTLPLRWGPVAGDLVEERGEGLVLSLALPRLFRERLEAEREPARRFLAALAFATEVAGLLAPAVTRRAQAALAGLPEADQRAALELAEATAAGAGPALGAGVDALVQALLAGPALP